MKVKKILIYLVLISLLISTVSACGNKNNGSDGSTTTDAPIDTAPIEIEDEGINFWVENNAGFDSATPGAAEDFEIEIANGTVTILSYKGTNEHLIIPEEINGMPVVAIADGAFTISKEEEGSEENEEETPFSLQTLIIPESITSIGTGILAGCETLHTLQTPLMGADKESAQFLGYLFGASRYEDNARDIPASLTCLRLTGDWQSLQAYSLFDCNDLICLALPDEITTIEKFALYNCASLKEITGLEKVVTFGDRALMNCSALQTVTVGNGAQSIGFGAFEGCTSIRAMTLPFVGATPNENTYLGYIFGAAHPDFAKGFYPQNLSRITLSDACQTLGNYAFFECESLKEVVIPTGLTSIGVRAFYGCISLWGIRLPDTVITIRELAFANCDALIFINFGEGLTSIGINAFYNCDSLEEIVLPETLKSIPASCFAGCTSLANIDLGGVREVGAQAFRHCNAVKTVTAGGKVEFAEGNDSVKSVLNP